MLKYDPYNLIEILDNPSAYIVNRDIHFYNQNYLKQVEGNDPLHIFIIDWIEIFLKYNFK